MKFVKWLILLVAVLLGLFFIITFFLPKDYRVERAVEIAAGAPLIYSQVIDLEVWQEWNPWHELDPDMVVEYGDSRSGPGASYVWRSDIAGNGAMTIIGAAPLEEVRFEIIFDGYEELPSYSTIRIEPLEGDAACRVIWSFEGTVGENFFARWMTVMADKFVGPSYETGLQALKQRCEALAADPEAVFEKIPLP
jgi:hypothetical protein